MYLGSHFMIGNLFLASCTLQQRFMYCFMVVGVEASRRLSSSSSSNSISTSLSGVGDPWLVDPWPRDLDVPACPSRGSLSPDMAAILQPHSESQPELPHWFNVLQHFTDCLSVYCVSVSIASPLVLTIVIYWSGLTVIHIWARCLRHVYRYW